MHKLQLMRFNSAAVRPVCGLFIIFSCCGESVPRRTHVPRRTQAKTPLGNGLKQAVKIFQKEAKSLNFYSYYFFRCPLRRLRI